MRWVVLEVCRITIMMRKIFFVKNLESTSKRRGSRFKALCRLVGEF